MAKAEINLGNVGGEHIPVLYKSWTSDGGGYYFKLSVDGVEVLSWYYSDTVEWEDDNIRFDSVGPGNARRTITFKKTGCGILQSNGYIKLAGESIEAIPGNYYELFAVV